MNIIEAKGIWKFYKKFSALKGISLSIPKGSSFCLLGPNGAGKTTLISILTTILALSRGRVTISGYDLKNNPGDIREKIGVVFQDQTVDNALTPKQILHLQGLLYGMDKDEIVERSYYLLDLLELNERQDDLIERLSGGTKRKVELAMGLIHKPELLFLDEPTLGLDPKARLTIWNHIAALNKQGVTVFFSTNYIEEAEFLSSHIGILNHGKLIVADAKKTLLSKISKDRMIISFFGITAPQKELLAKKFGSSYCSESLQLQISHADAIVQEIVSQISEMGLKIKSFNIIKPNLGDVYLKYTGENID
ncbi:MAG: ATP-binding cassette domain-containing protein [archaeon]